MLGDPMRMLAWS